MTSKAEIAFICHCEAMTLPLMAVAISFLMFLGGALRRVLAPPRLSEIATRYAFGSQLQLPLVARNDRMGRDCFVGLRPPRNDQRGSEIASSAESHCLLAMTDQGEIASVVSLPRKDR